MVSSSKTIGNINEKLALDFLLKNNLQLLEKNYSSRFGEIDLVMLDDHVLVFIEVRYRKTRDFGSALESVDRAKQQRLLTTAQCFLKQHRKFQHHICRFDVVAIELDSDHQAQYDWVKSAFIE